MTKHEVEMLAALRARYRDEDGYALIPQVPDGTAWQKKRTADALLFSLWKTRGIYIHGLEIKASRGDFFKEVDHADKSESIAKYCHCWSIVAPKDMLKPNELPPAWGLIEVADGTTKVKKRAPYRDDVEPLTHGFIAGVMRAAQRAPTSKADLMAEFNRGFRAGKTVAEAHAKRDADGTDLHRLRESVEEFEQASGIRIESYSGAHLGEQFRRFQEFECIGPTTSLRQALNTNRFIISSLQNAIEAARRRQRELETYLHEGKLHKEA